MDGILIVNKPAGLTSHDVVDFVRRHFKIKKVGHAGTLDPVATGVLVILLGKATKLSSQLVKDDKEYIATLRLGVVTDSGDSMGKVVSTTDKVDVKRENAEEAFKRFCGPIKQTPPMVSALRHKGKRLYELARRGLEVPRQPRNIYIHKLEITRFNPPDIDFHLVASKGTYVRTLCTDIGQMLGCGGHAIKMHRIRSGAFSIKDSLTLERLSGMSREDLKKIVIRRQK